MRNASGHQCKGKMSGSEKKKSERERVQHFLHKKVSGRFTLWSCKTTANKCTKKVCCTCKVAFLLIRPIVVFLRSPALPSLLALHDSIFCLNKLKILSRASLLALAKSIYYHCCCCCCCSVDDDT